MPDVTIIGAGIAGLSAALRLLERGISVEVLEQDGFVGGKWSAHRLDEDGGDGDYHEHCYHMLCNWYGNLWRIIDDLGIRDNFEPVHHLNYLRADDWPRITELRDVGAMGTALPNLFSGVMSLPDTFLYGYSLIDLTGRTFVRSNFLDRYSVNGFMHSRPYTTVEAARQHHRTLAKAFAAPSYQTSAATYRNFIRYGFRDPSPMMWLQKDNSYNAFFAPLLERLKSHGDRFRLSTHHRVTGFELADGRIGALRGELVKTSPSVAYYGKARTAGKFERASPGNVVLAVPADAVARMLDPELFAHAPTLCGVRKLRSEPMASIDLHFTRRIEKMPKGITVMMDAAWDLTFIDNAQQWPGFENTYLNIIISDFDELAGLPAFADGRTVDLEHPRSVMDYVLRELHRFIPFDPQEDIDLDRTYVQTNIGERLMVNDVGSWDYRPPTCTGVPNLFVAGDYCRHPIDAVTLEGATITGLMAAEEIRKALGHPDPVEISEPKAWPTAAMAATAAAGAPWAYAAKAAATLGEEAWITYQEFMGED